MTATADHRERAFEEAIQGSLVAQAGYRAVEPGEYDTQHRLVSGELFAFIQGTQAEAWERLARIHGPAVKARFLKRLCDEIDHRGTVDVLRHGVTDQGIELAVCYFAPAHAKNPELVERYEANRLAVMRQVPYSPDHQNTVDLLLAVNGIPTATAELKNPLTGQTVEDAKRQYRHDRDPRDILLSKRAVVHFAVDPDEVYMATHLEGTKTRFLPFNRGSTEEGAGNPPNPGGYATAYLWEQVWARDAWLDLLGRFIHVEKPKGSKRRRGAKTEGTVIFPRFHQWDAVRRLEAHASEHGAGQTYLIQHSAGSGKSNSIAWLAHRLASLHDQAGSKVFDKVVVVTDRRVLDKQLQDTIFQFEHTHGVVARVGEEARQQGMAKSQRLAEVLEGSREKILICTLQTFPLVVDAAGDQTGRRHAVIVDEAHSSQSGEAARDLKATLGGARDDEEALRRAAAAEHQAAREAGDGQDTVNAAVQRAAAERGPQTNLSFFAFTATPKAKTLELFGQPTGSLGDLRQRYAPFHLYSMRQAIEEGFILDVLANYTTYQTYWKLAKAAEDDPEMPTSKASAAAARYVSLHPHSLAQKAEIIVEHFRKHTAGKIGGKAKAMVVTSSRLHAVRYKQAVDAYIEQQGYAGIGTLVAFSGTVPDPIGGGFTEAGMNAMPESRTVAAFESGEYQLMVVAEKYQTGFDQPLLHTMFVDKKLDGVNAVQTLSRLNRIHPGKDDTFVLDFVNDAEQIQEAFKPFYERTVAAATDPNAAHDAARELDEFAVVHAHDVDAFAGVYFTADPADQHVHAQLYVHLDPARDRFEALDDDERAEFRAALRRFINTYAFIAQVASLADPELEKRYIYCRLLQYRLPKEGSGALDLGEDIELTHLRTVKTGDHDLSLAQGEGELEAFTGDAAGKHEQPTAPLSEIIELLNQRFGTDLGQEDALQLEGIGEHMAADEHLQQQAQVNDVANFRYPFEQAFTGAIIDMMERNEGLSQRLLDDEEFRETVMSWLLPRVYEKSRGPIGGSPTGKE